MTGIPFVKRPESILGAARGLGLACASRGA
jgi:hypothetical protein